LEFLENSNLVTRIATDINSWNRETLLMWLPAAVDERGSDLVRL